MTRNGGHGIAVYNPGGPDRPLVPEMLPALHPRRAREAHRPRRLPRGLPPLAAAQARWSRNATASCADRGRDNARGRRRIEERDNATVAVADLWCGNNGMSEKNHFSPFSRKSFHFTGSGTAMGAVAAAMKSARLHGHRHRYERVSADVGFPPRRGDHLHEGYREENIPADTDVVIIGNAISRGNPEAEATLDRKLLYIRCRR